MTYPKFEHEKHAMTDATLVTDEKAMELARSYASRLVNHAMQGTSDLDGALFRIEQHYGISPNQIQHLRKGRAKTCDLGLFGRIRAAYLDLCERQISRLQQEIEIEKAMGNVDDDLADIETLAKALAEKVRAKKAGRK